MITTLALLATLLNPIIPIQDTPSPNPSPNPSPQTSPLNVQSVDTLQMRCMPREQLISHIKSSNHAVPMFVAMSGHNGSEGGAIEFWRDTSNPNRQMWISFITRTDGKSCIVMQGDGFGLADPKAFYETPNFDYDAQGKPHPHVDEPGDHS